MHTTQEGKKTTDVRFLKFDSRRCFGLEMEFNRYVSQENLHRAIARVDRKHQIMRSGGYQQDYNNNYWHVKFDRSCGDRAQEGGWEVASYKGRGYADIDNMGKVAQEIRNAGAQCNKNCAVHVHAEISDFSQADAAALVANWMKIERILMETLPKHRRGNEYCVPLTTRHARIDLSRKYTPAEFWVLVRPTAWDHPNRRVSLNMVNFAQNAPGRMTAEIRVPEGTCDPKDIKNWIRWFVHFVDWSKEIGFPKSLLPVETVDEALAVSGLHHEAPFYILSKPLRNTKMWFLRRLQLYCNNKSLLEQAKKRIDLMTGPAAKDYYRPAIQVVPNETRPPDVRPSEWLKHIAEKYRRLQETRRSSEDVIRPAGRVYEWMGSQSQEA